MKNIFFLIMCFLTFFAQANVVITGTRVIYNEDEKSIAVKLNNTGSGTALVQAWIEDKMVNQQPSQGTSPFLLYPAVSKIPSNGEQYLRIKKIQNIPNNQVESLYWLNVKDIPEAPKNKDANYLQLSILSKLKLFYRPAYLKGKQNQIYNDLSWSLSTKNGQQYLVVKNNSPFYASFTEVKKVNVKKGATLPLDMVPPKSSFEWVIKNISLADIKNNKTEYGLVNDYGAVVYRPIILQ